MTAHVSNLTGQFLIAMPALADPNFSHTVTYICEHNEHGSMGITINRPAGVVLGDLYEQLGIAAEDPKAASIPLFIGGPVEIDRGFILHDSNSEWLSTLRINDQFSITTSLDILEAIASGQGPDRALISLGYAGWGDGQLEAELKDNAWLSGPADPQLVFESEIDDRWRQAAGLLGIDLGMLSDQAGHA